jgi:AraC family transcriptional regulator, transcriptional activator of pobA
MSTSSPAAFIDQARANGKPAEQQVRVQKFGDSGGKLLPYSRRDYFKIWMIKTKGKIHFATHSIDIDQPALIFSNPRVPYAFESGDVAGAYMCIFTEEFLKLNGRTESLQDSPLFKIGAQRVFFPDPTQYDFIASFFERMLSEQSSSYVHRLDIIRQYINLIIHEGMKMEPALSSIKYHNASERIASLFLELLERQFPIESPEQALKLRRASDYAESLSVHVNHLNHAVREITGKPTSAHITDRIIVEAKALLHHTDLSITDIAYCLGFDYPNYFNNFFKKNTGVTPLSVRK